MTVARNVKAMPAIRSPVRKGVIVILVMPTVAPRGCVLLRGPA